MTATDGEGKPSGDQLREEAARWFARMRGEEADLHRADFERWLARGAVHRAAYNRIGEIFAAGKSLKSVPAATRLAAPGKTLGIAIVGFVILVGLIVYGARRLFGPEVGAIGPSGEQHATTVGETARFGLADGTRVVLDTGTLLLTPGNGGGSARLDHGRARFIVPIGNDRSVLVGGLRARSDGGTFDLALDDGGDVDAALLRGHLALEPAVYRQESITRSRLVLAAGQRYRLASDGTRSIGDAALGDEWPDSILEFRHEPLSRVLAAVNRYSGRKIMLADPALGARLVSGRFRVGSPEHVARHLAAALSLRLDDGEPGMIILAAGVPGKIQATS